VSHRDGGVEVQLSLQTPQGTTEGDECGNLAKPPPALIRRTSILSKCQHDIKAGGIAEGAEVPIPREEGNSAIDTTLGN
jgi:hypothetical protein